MPYSYKLPTTLQHNAPIVRFALTSLKEGGQSREAGAWSKGINIHSFSLEKEECIKLYLETRNSGDSEQNYETLYLSVKNTLLQTTVTLFSPIRVLSLLSTPIEVQMRNDKLVSNAVTPATTSLLTYLHAIEHPEDRKNAAVYYSPFPFAMVNHFDYYDKDREENQNHVYIRLRSKAAGIWGSWLRVPDVYYGQEYRLCRIHIPIDRENNYNYCYLVNRYSDEGKVNYIELLPSVVFVNETSEELYFKHYINEGRIGCRHGENVEQIDSNYMLNNDVNNRVMICGAKERSCAMSALQMSEKDEEEYVVSVDDVLKYDVTRKVIYHHRGNHYAVEVIRVYPLLQCINRVDLPLLLSCTVLSHAKRLVTRQTLLAANASQPLSIAVDGKDFNATSSLSPIEEAPTTTQPSEAHISFSFQYEENRCVWSNSMTVSLEAGSFCAPQKEECLLVPVYDAARRDNECFMPIVMNVVKENHRHYLVISPLAMIRNELSASLMVRTQNYSYMVEGKKEKPFYTKSIECAWSRYAFSVCAAEDGWLV